MKFRKKIAVSMLTAMMVFAFMGAMNPGSASNNSLNAVALELNSSTVIVGFGVTVHLTGLTDGTCYLVVGRHSSANYTGVSTCTGTEDHVKIGPFTSADSDGVVPVSVGTTTDYAETASYTATAILTLEAASIPGAEFFTGIISDLVLISVVVGLLGVFIGGGYLYSKKRG